MTYTDFIINAREGATGHKFGQAREAVVRVGDGRGFIVGAGYKSYIVTAAHCLPERARHLYPHLGNGINELLVKNLIGPLAPKRHERKIWAELCGLSQTDDLAVFCEPDNQAFGLGDEPERYRQFTDRGVLAVAPSPAVVQPYLWEWPGRWPGRYDTATTVPPVDAFVLGLDLTWKPCTVYNTGRFLTLLGVPIEGGMSGSPILNAEGAAIGVISTGNESYRHPGDNTHPSLMDCLPPWLWREMADDTVSSQES
jgi:hypothetical protein